MRIDRARQKEHAAGVDLAPSGARWKVSSDFGDLFTLNSDVGFHPAFRCHDQAVANDDLRLFLRRGAARQREGDARDTDEGPLP